MKIIKILDYILDQIKSLFLSGFITIIPLAATLFFVHFTYNTLAKWLMPLKKLEPEFLQKVPGAEIVIFIIFILLIGALVKLFIITPIIHRIEKIIIRIPLLRMVYSSAKTLVEFFNVPNPATASKKVVLIQYPRKGSYNLAFMLESANNDFGKIINDNRNFFKVFMPNSPNPTSGYFFILPEEEIIPTNITFEEAIKAVVSCGLITPETIKTLKK
ncbi:DUF502 domain-containing protein [Candidatus Dependentiae bacterium]|nr:DUF502 domain-containing protein [Candidatus Dependentiae bacterium]